MKKNYYLSLSLVALLSSGVFAQDNKGENPSDPHQKTLQIENAASKETAIDQFSKLYNLDKRNNTFEAKKENADISGMIHQRNQQYYKGIKVEFGTAITHARNGAVVSVNGELYNPGELNTTPSLSAENCFARAISYMPSNSKFVWEDKAEAAAMEYSKPTGELVILPILRTGEIKLAYKFDIFSSTPIAREEIFVDANSGALLYRNPIIKHADRLVSKAENDKVAKHVEKIVTGSKAVDASKAFFATGSAATRYSGVQNIETTLDVGISKYVLNDMTRGNGIMTYNSANTNSTAANTNFTDTDNNWNDGNYTAASSTRDNAALDAHWGAMKTYDFWKNTFNRNSFDDNGAQIKNYVHFNQTNNGASGWDNAQWTGTIMRYGDGNSFDVLTAVDVIGHEIGHAVCQYTAGLAYQNQSGAMNEGYSDIWGACIEQYAKFGNLNAGQDTASPGTLAVWKIGEQLSGSPLRSMSYPTTRGNADTFLGTNYADTQDDAGASGSVCNTPGQNTNDWCGVHNNSGVLNHWFYILTAGKAGTNNASAANGGPDVYNVAGIGMTKSSQIAYYTERDYLTANAKFSDARNGSIAVASSLYCATSPEVQAVTKAWYAVNVGADYVGLANDVSIKSILGGNSSVACGSAYNPSIIIENAGTANISAATITYNVDGGANSTINWTGSLTNCSTTPQAIPVSGLTRGFHTLNVTTTTAGDGNATNNTKSLGIVVNDSGTVNVINTFTAATDVLVSIDVNGKTNTLWERGTVNKTPLTSAATGNSAGYATKLVGNYPDKTTSYLVSQCYNLSNITSPTVNFDMAFDLESNWDIIYFEYSTDSGATWNVLGTSADANWYNSPRLPDGTDCFNCIGKQWTGLYATAPASGTGVNGNKRNYSHTLNTLGSPANAIFRFTFISDDGSNNTGVFIDNFVIQGTLSTAENQFENFGVYPNPSNGVFNVVLSTSEKVNVSLYDLRGRSIYNNSFANTGSVFSKELNFSTLSSGIYILNVESAGKKASRRIIID
ncbi:MAG: M4 family metallopeptidase [Flavobacterium sp.]